MALQLFFYKSPSVEVAELPKISYQVHIQNIGWQEYVGDSDVAGTSGLNLRLESLKINLQNPIGDMKIIYQVHVNLSKISRIKEPK